VAKGKETFCIIGYGEEIGVEKAVQILHDSQKILHEKLGLERPLEEIFVQFRSLQAAVYYWNTTGWDFWNQRPLERSPGRISVIYHPMYARGEAMKEYLRASREGGFQPIFLSDYSTLDVRRKKKSLSEVELEMPGVRQVVRALAESFGAAVVEADWRDLIKV